MLRITFLYADALSNWQTRTQHCTVDTIEECKRIYGLNCGGVEYSILSVENDEECEMNNRFMSPFNANRITNCTKCGKYNTCKEIHK